MPARQQQVVEERVFTDAIETEKYVLAACLKDSRLCVDAVESLSTEDFSLEIHKRIWRIIAELAEVGDTVDRVTVYTRLQSVRQLPEDGLSYLISLDDGMPQMVQIRGWIKILQEKSRLRKIILIGQDAINAAQQGDEESDRILKRLDEQCYKSFRRAEGSYIVSIGDYMKSLPPLAILDPKGTRERSGKTILHTGFRRLDELTDGFHEAEIWVTGAATSVGKTTIALQMVTYLASQGIPVLFFSLEMPKEAILNRLMCRKAGVSVMRFRSGDLSQKERLRLQEACYWVENLPLYIDDTAALRASDVYLRTRRAKDQHGIQLATIDFIQKMRSGNSRMNRNDQITEICESIQIAAKELVPFHVLSQLSRAHKKEKRKPNLEDLRESGSVEQFANVVLMPYRPEMDNQKDESLRGKAEFLLRKNRDGEREEIPMRYVGWLMQFEDTDAPNSYVE